MATKGSYNIFFIGDGVATVDFGNLVNEEINKRVIALFNYLSHHPLEGMIEAIPAYSSLAVYFDMNSIRKKLSLNRKISEWIKERLDELMQNDFADSGSEQHVVRVPVCYEEEFGIDLPKIAEEKSISIPEIIQLHSSKMYRVYMLGFLPGFPYMGEVEEKLVVPRKTQPEPVLAGSVGITGKQTGIYPLNSPGGWQIVGRTPLKMFDKNKNEPCLLNAGDYVAFYPITKNEFESYQGWGA